MKLPALERLLVTVLGTIIGIMVMAAVVMGYLKWETK